MYPAFHAYLSSSQTVADSATTKVQIDTEILIRIAVMIILLIIRFTPTVAGKYYVYSFILLKPMLNVINDVSVYFIKMVQNISEVRDNPVSSERGICRWFKYIDFNGTTDYVEIFGRINVIGTHSSFVASATKINYISVHTG